MSAVDQFALGSRLKAHRERRGVTLGEIAESTKIAPSLLSSLESNDVSQWPKGIYRRAFLRSYARAIDIPFEPVWAEFIQLFPEDGVAPTVPRFTETSQLRLVLGTQRLRTPSISNLEAAAVDVLVVLGVGLIASLLPSISAWMGVALTSLLYGAVSTAIVGESLGRWYLRTSRARHSAAAPAPGRELVIADSHTSDDEGPAVVEDEPKELSVSAALPRPRIFAVATSPADALERRVADR